MIRHHFVFSCEGDILHATVDGGAEARVGLLLVSGGNELRAGAFAGQALMATSLAAHGFAVMRFDRRGVGDSTGINTGFRGSNPDIMAAAAAFRIACPHMRSLVAMGNCDAASALMIGGGEGCDGLILSNPWTYDETDADEPALPPPAAIRARYMQRLKDPREWVRLLRGGVNLKKLAAGLRAAMRPPAAPTTLAQDMADGLARFAGPCLILLAGRDKTAQAFLALWDGSDPRLRWRATADHAYSDQADQQWLHDQVAGMLRDQSLSGEETGQLNMG